MRPYLDLLQRILDANRLSENRTATKTIKVAGEMMKFDLMREGKRILPLVTTKKVFYRGIFGENLWLLDGNTNIQWLLDHGIHIWDQWAITDPKVHSVTDWIGSLQRTQDVTKTKVGDLGPVYGAQWRTFPAGEFFYTLTDEELQTYIDNMEKKQKALLNDAALLPHGVYDLRLVREELTTIGIDQISQTLFLLRNRPNSRRIIVTAWNPQVVPSDDISAQENVELGRAALASCHTLFQFLTEELSVKERLALVPIPQESEGLVVSLMPPILALNKLATKLVAEGKIPAEAVYQENNYLANDTTLLDLCGIPKYRLNCVLYQRSADCFLGVPFNIASYSLLTHMVATEVNMVPGQFTWMGGDVHLYVNHLDQVKEQLSREPYPEPELWLNPEVKSIFEYTLEDIKLINYKSHGRLKGEVSI